MKLNFSVVQSAAIAVSVLCVSVSGKNAEAQTPAVNFADVIAQTTCLDPGIYPDGVPTSYDWYRRGRCAVGPMPPPSNFTSLTAWGVVYSQAGFANVKCNIIIKGWQTYVHKKTGGWLLVSDQDSMPTNGGQYPGDFGAGTVFNLPVTRQADGSEIMPSPPQSYNDHIWPQARVSYAADSIDGMFTLMMMKTDSSACNMVAELGADYWLSPTAPYTTLGANNPEYGIGTFVKLSTSYQYLYYTRFRASDLMADPPPPLKDALLTPAPVSTPEPTPTPEPVPVPTPAPSSKAITMGETRIMGTADNGNGNLLVAQSATLAQAGSLTSLSFYVTRAAGQLRLAVYAADGPNGRPGTKVAETAAFTPIVGWNQANVMKKVSLPAGKYWLAYLPSSSRLAFRNGVSRGSSAVYYRYSFGAMPGKFSSRSNSANVHWSLYANVTVP